MGGWMVSDVLRKVDMGVNKILDDHGIVGNERDHAMDHFNNKLSKVLDEISAEKVMKEYEEFEDKYLEEDAYQEELEQAEIEVVAHMDAVINRAKAVDGWDVDDVLRKVNVGVSKILDDHAISGATKEKAMDHLNIKLITMLEEISAAKEMPEVDFEEPEEHSYFTDSEEFEEDF